MGAPAVVSPEAPGVGLHRGLSYETYHAIEAINHSILRLFARSPLHARAEMLHPVAPTGALDFGIAVHQALLEPDQFRARYVEGSDLDRRYKEGKAAWAAIETAHPGKTLMRPKEWAEAERLAAAMWEHPTLGGLMRAPGVNEVVAVWDDPETGVRCKARLDTFRRWRHPEATQPSSYVVDLKSSRNASPDAFSRDVAKYGYHQQAAFYLDGLAILQPASRRYLLGVLEKEAPHAVAVYELSEMALRAGREQYRVHLNRYAECLKSGHWPGYYEGILELDLPPWAVRAVSSTDEEE